MSRIFNESIPQTICGLFELRCSLTPDKPAFFQQTVTGQWQPISWGELRERTRHCAAALRRTGLRPGAAVAILLPLDTLWYPIANAVYQNRGVVVSLDAGYRAAEIAEVLRHCGAAMLITDGKQLEKLRAASVLDRSVQVVLVDGNASQADASGALCLQTLLEPPEDGDALAELPPPSGNDLATIVYTSGTTGTAKGIAYRHEQVMGACGALADAYAELGPEDRTICWLPLSAMFQRMANLLGMVCGMETYFVTDPRLIIEQMIVVQPTLCIGVPRFYEKLNEALTGDQALQLGQVVRSAKLMISGSAPIPIGLLQSLHEHGAPVREAYGLSENTVPVSCNRISDYRFGSVGKPLPPNEVRLAEDGEVLVRGLGVFSGYLGDRPSRDLFTDDGFYRTGDLGRFDEDGYLFLIGRKRDLIKTSTGRRIGPSKIEAVYALCPSIDQIVVIGDGRKYLAALVTLSRKGREQLRGQRDAAAPPNGNTQSSNHASAQQLLEEWLLAGESLAADQRIEAFGVLARSFQGDEITSSQKLRRAVIVERHAELIERVYQHSTPCIVLQSGEVVAGGAQTRGTAKR